MPDEEDKNMKLAWSDVAIIVSALMITIVFVLTADTDLRWVAHGLAGIFSLIFSVAAALVGAQIVGRIKRPKGINLFKLHRKIAIYLAALVVITFAQGLWDRIAHGEPLFWQHVEPLGIVVQGWFGLFVTILAISQLVPALVVKDRRKIRKLHRILGYTMVISLVIQTFLGVEAALVESMGHVLLMHSPLLNLG